MSSLFSPVEDLQIFCRFCNKVVPVQLDRSIAENGRSIDKNSTFEYLCSKCYKTTCFSGNDLVEKNQDDTEHTTPRIYNPKDHYYIGETLKHKKWKESGLVVGIEHGNPNRILVNFEKSGIKKLVDDMK